MNFGVIRKNDRYASMDIQLNIHMKRFWHIIWIKSQFGSSLL